MIVVERKVCFAPACLGSKKKEEKVWAPSSLATVEIAFDWKCLPGTVIFFFTLSLHSSSFIFLPLLFPYPEFLLFFFHSFVVHLAICLLYQHHPVPPHVLIIEAGLGRLLLGALLELPDIPTFTLERASNVSLRRHLAHGIGRGFLFRRWMVSRALCPY